MVSPVVLRSCVERIYGNNGCPDSPGADLSDADCMTKDRLRANFRIGSTRKPEDENCALPRVARRELLTMLCSKLDFTHTEGVEARDPAFHQEHIGRDVTRLFKGSLLEPRGGGVAGVPTRSVEPFDRTDQRSVRAELLSR